MLSIMYYIYAHCVCICALLGGSIEKSDSDEKMMADTSH